MKGFKPCAKCGKEYPATKKHFYVNEYNDDGLFTLCKKCCRQSKKVCPDCGEPIRNRAKRCVTCREINRRHQDHERIKAGNGRSIGDNFSFKEIIHKEQGDACVVCGWTITKRIYGGCVAHHIVPVSDGGKSVVENGAVLCPNCHVKAHIGLITKEDLFIKIKKATDTQPQAKDIIKIIDSIREDRTMRIFKALGYDKLSDKDLVKLILSIAVKTEKYRGYKNGYFMYDFLLSVYDEIKQQSALL